jgi:hypothetical protein
MERLFVLPVLAFSVWVYAAGKTSAFEGTLVSATCYMSDHSATANDMFGSKECGSGCLEQGKPGGLLTKDNQFYMLDAPSLRLAPYVGQQIRITGEELSKDILSVKTVAVKKGNGWESIDIRYHPQK